MGEAGREGGWVGGREEAGSGAGGMGLRVNVCEGWGQGSSLLEGRKSEQGAGQAWERGGSGGQDHQPLPCDRIVTPPHPAVCPDPMFMTNPMWDDD